LIIKGPGARVGAQVILLQIPEDNSTIIILCNTGSANHDDIAAEIAKHVLTRVRHKFKLSSVIRL
jgi:hypothetical protein